ncbi:MAG: CAP domain-containing protein [Dehalococcoidia bacterium]|nr:CAP domain-containing protein [Dehalococcoidia bacterium]
MRRIAFVALAGLVLTGFAASTHINSASATTAACAAVDGALDPEEVAFYLLINSYREQNGLPPLTISSNLTRASVVHAESMGSRGFFGHDDPSGSTPASRAASCGYSHGVGENIAAGTNWQSGLAAFEAWRNSPSHNANMLDGRYRQVGIARHHAPGSMYTWYWVTDFGTQFDGTDGTDLRLASSGIASAGLKPAQWNVATVLPGGLRVKDIHGYTAWDQLPNGNWQQWGSADFIPGGSTVGLLPIGMSMDKGRNPR